MSLRPGTVPVSLVTGAETSLAAPIALVAVGDVSPAPDWGSEAPGAEGESEGDGLASTVRPSDIDIDIESMNGVWDCSAAPAVEGGEDGSDTGDCISVVEASGEEGMVATLTTVVAWTWTIVVGAMDNAVETITLVWTWTCV